MGYHGREVWEEKGVIIFSPEELRYSSPAERMGLRQQGELQMHESQRDVGGALVGRSGKGLASEERMGTGGPQQ